MKYSLSDIMRVLEGPEASAPEAIRLISNLVLQEVELKQQLQTKEREYDVLHSNARELQRDCISMLRDNVALSLWRDTIKKELHERASALDKAVRMINGHACLNCGDADPFRVKKFGDYSG